VYANLPANIQDMQLKWREHERILVTMITLLTLGAWWWRMYQVSYRPHNPVYATPFTIPVHYYTHIFLPQIAPVLLLYFCFLWVDMRIVPGFLLPGKEMPGNKKPRLIAFLGMHPWETVQVMLLLFLLGTGLTIAANIRRHNGIPGHEPLRITDGLSVALALVLLYAIYIVVRELTIGYIERSGNKRSYRVMIANHITVFVVGIVVAAKIFIIFEFMHDWPVSAFYALAICSFIVGLSNIYWLFPSEGKERFFNYRLLFRLLVLTFACTLPFFIAFRALFLFLWVFQLFIVTPVSWELYQLRKDKIQGLRGMEKELVQSRSDLAFLRSQINPHFLFNVLNTLYGTAFQERAERTAEGIQKLGDMMRFMLHENNLDFIQMSKEIEYLKNYIVLQKLRTQSSPEIIIEDNISEQNCNHKIAPMLLIPLVENAFKHGISLKERSWIKINLECTEKNILFEVRNSMHEKISNDPEKEKSGIGFKNVLERLKLIYPGRFQISVNGDGTEFFVQLSIEP